jgi:hypothetical protein
MKRFIVPALVLTLASGVALAVKSGLESGESPAAFNVKDVTGPSKGKSLCYRCQYGAKPVACVFTREITPEVTALIQEIDKQVGANKNKNMQAFVVLLTDDAEKGSKQLEQVAAEAGVKNVPLTVYDGAAGPEQYKIAKDAAVTVLMWNKSRVQVNHAFEKGKLTKDDVSKVAADTTKILQ